MPSDARRTDRTWLSSAKRRSRSPSRAAISDRTSLLASREPVNVVSQVARDLRHEQCVRVLDVACGEVDDEEDVVSHEAANGSSVASRSSVICFGGFANACRKTSRNT